MSKNISDEERLVNFIECQTEYVRILSDALEAAVGEDEHDWVVDVASARATSCAKYDMEAVRQDFLSHLEEVWYGE